MISPKSYEEMATYLEKPEKVVFFFTANWCPDCQFIYPVMPEIEAENIPLDILYERFHLTKELIVKDIMNSL